MGLKQAATRIGWFVLIWLASIAVLGVVAYIIRLFIT